MKNENHVKNLLNNEKIEDTKNDNCIIKFSADWCGPCKQYVNIFEDVAKENTNISFYNVDISHDLSKTYNVRALPFTIFLKKNNLVFEQPGLLDKEKLNNLIEKYFNN